MDIENDEIRQLEAEINACKQLLNNTDYVTIKIAEGVAEEDEYTDIIAKRQEWRNKINECEALISNLNMA